MKKVLLDTNIYDLVSQSDEAKSLITKLSDAKQIKILASDNVNRELAGSPFNGNPRLFPIEETTDSVFILDHSRLDFARLGSGDVFHQHRGESNKTSDAVIADTAATDADIFVSEDNRCRNRLAKFNSNCLTLNFSDFLEYLRTEYEI